MLIHCGLHAEYFLSPWSMLFHPIKVLLTASAILFKIHSEYCDIRGVFSAIIWENLTCINISNSIIPTSKNFPWKSTLVTFLWKFALLRVLCHFFQYGCKAKDINGHASTEICQWNAISSTGLGTSYFNYVIFSF